MKNLLTFILLAVTLNVYCQDQSVTVTEPEFIGNVVYVKDNKVFDLEKQKVHVTVKAGAGLFIMGLGKIKKEVVVSGPNSDVKIASDRNVKFIVKVVDNKYDPFEIIEIFKLKKSYNSRSLLTAEVGSFSGSKSGDIVRVPYKAVKYGTSSFLVTVSEFTMGEYAMEIKLRTENGAQDAGTFTLHLFSISKTSFKIGDKVEYLSGGHPWIGIVDEIKENKIKIKTTNQGHESTDRLDLENAEIRTYSEEDPINSIPLKKEDMSDGIKVGDKVKWKVLLVDNWNGTYLGSHEGNAVIQTTDRGKVVYKEVEYGKNKFTKDTE